MAAYDLSHLTQSEQQIEMGPIQDDEALFLYALVRGKRMRRILEAGGLDGYSARNFLQALRGDGVVYTVDLSPVSSQADNHIVIQKDIAELKADDLGGEPLDLVFFDCHVFDGQMALFENLRRAGVIHDGTVLALHDTNLHPEKFLWWSEPLDEGWVHQKIERRMVNALHEQGYDAFMLHTDMRRHDEAFPMRHGLTLMQKFKPLSV